MEEMAQAQAIAFEHLVVLSGVTLMALPDLETEALRLDPRERARLAHVIVASLSELTTDEIQELWLEEAERRDAELESGEVTGIPASEVFTRIRDRHS